MGETDMRIGIPGLGRMGTAMAERLRELGHDLVVWNRSPEKANPLVEAGAQAASSPADLAAKADVILTILTDAAAIDAVYRGADGLLAAELGGKLVIDMSTVQPETAIALTDAVRNAGASFVECPVGITVTPARTGKLLGLAGGERVDVARALPILEGLCRRIEHVGPVGAGASMKLAINLPLVVFYQALGESLTLIRHLGQDPNWLMEFFADTSGAANVLKARGPLFAEALAGRDPPPAFDVSSIRKDLRTMIAEAGRLGTTLPLAERTLGVFDEAAEAGWDGKDGSSLPAFWPGRSTGG